MPQAARAEPYLLPVFPLQQVVLFPRIRCPLHVFEPRYRQLTELALAGERRIGMIAVLPDGVRDMAGDPPLYAVGCEGRIVDSARLADGRFNVLLLGMHRFRVLEEPERPADQLFRTLRVEALEDVLDPASRVRIAALRARVIELSSEWLGRLARGELRLEPARLAAADDVALVNGLCQLLDLAPAEKQALLETGEIAARYRGLSEVLQFRLAELEAARGPSSRQLH